MCSDGYSDNEKGYGSVGSEGIWEISVPSFQLCYKP